MDELTRLREGMRRLFNQTDPVQGGEDCDACGVRPGSDCGSCGGGDDIQESPLPAGGPVQPALLEVRPGDDVLELSGDGGAEARSAWLRAGPSGSVVSLEEDEETLVRARLETARAGLSGVSFIQGSPDSIPVQAESFDVVTADNVLGLIRNPGNALAGIRRVLRPGGRLSLLEIISLDGAQRQVGGLGRARDEDWWRRALDEAGFGSVSLGLLADGPAVTSAWLGSPGRETGLGMSLIEATAM